MTVVERPGEKVTPEETKRATYKPALSQPRGRVTPKGERGEPPGIGIKYITAQSPAAEPCSSCAQVWINQTRQPKKNLKNLPSVLDGGGRPC